MAVSWEHTIWVSLGEEGGTWASPFLVGNKEPGGAWVSPDKEGGT